MNLLNLPLSSENLKDSTSFYLNPLALRRSDGASKGGEEAVPHKLVKGCNGAAQQQTYYFSAGPSFYGSEDYDGCQ